MLLTALLQKFQLPGPALICAGLAIVLATQFWVDVPIASALLLIGWGSTLTGHARLRDGNILAILNLIAYALLGCLAVAVQTHIAATSLTSRLSTTLLVDHTVAIVMLLALLCYTLRRQFQTFVG